MGGEVRFDITRESVLELYEQRKNDEEFQNEYQSIIDDGKTKLSSLNGKDKSNFSVSYKDSMMNEREENTNSEFYLKQKAKELERQQIEEERKRLLQEQLKISKQKAQEKKELKEQQEREAKQKKQELLERRLKDAEEKKQREA